MVASICLKNGGFLNHVEIVFLSLLNLRVSSSRLTEKDVEVFSPFPSEGAT